MKITHCKLKKSIQKKLLQFFVLEVTARSAADLSGIHPNSAVLFYRKIREVISHHLSLEADTVFDGSVELDESYFGGHRKGKRGRGAADKVAVFGILKRGGKVYTVVIENAKRETLFPVITKKIMPDSIVYTDCLSSYDVLDVSGFTHHRINHKTTATRIGKTTSAKSPASPAAWKTAWRWPVTAKPKPSCSKTAYRLP